MDKPDKKKDLVWLAQVSSVGIALVISTMIGLGIGYFLDSKFHTPPIFLMIFMLLGIGAGFVNVFRTLAQGDTKRKPGNPDRPA